MSLTFNQFQVELRRRGIKEQEAYLFTLIYERLIETEKLVMMNAHVLEELTNSVASFVQISEGMQKELRLVRRGGVPDGVDVESVAWDKKLDDE